MPTSGSTAWRVAGLFFCVLACLTAGCGETERFPELEEAAPLEPAAQTLGVGLFHGDPLGLALGREGSFVEAAEAFEHALFRVKTYDELSVSVGEFHARAIRDDQVEFTVRGPSSFPDTGTPAARLAARAADIQLELERAFAVAGGEGFGTKSFVVDFWRERGDWMVRWDGNLSEGTNRVGQGNYGFDRADMVDDLLSHLATVAEEHQPRWIVVGDAVERFLADEAGEAGVSEEQFEAFREFFPRAVAAIKEASPTTRVAAGFHWEHLAGPVTARRTEVALSRLGEEELDEVFAEVVLPFVEAGDGLALRLRTERESIEPWKYQFLRRLPDLYGVDKPLMIYSVSTPITSRTAYRQQRLFFEEILAALGGLSPEVIAWERLTNVDGVDTADQEIIGRCRGLTGPDTRVAMDVARCYDGLFTLNEPKEVFGTFAGFAEP